MNKLFYPALFHKAEEGGYWVSFPDFPECMTQGEDMNEAYEMAIESLGLGIISRHSENQPIPAASDISLISPEPDTFPVLVEFDLYEYQKRNNSKAVKKTLSIPEWMNERAIALNINFSQLLQEALMDKFSISR